MILGYTVLPINQIKKIRFNKWDKYYNKIMIWEGEIENVTVRYKIDLATRACVFNSIADYKLNFIVECEGPAIDSFTIGPVIATTDESVLTQNFDPAGVLDEEPTSIDFNSITKLQFDNG